MNDKEELKDSEKLIPSKTVTCLCCGNSYGSNGHPFEPCWECGGERFDVSPNKNRVQKELEELENQRKELDEKIEEKKQELKEAK